MVFRLMSAYFQDIAGILTDGSGPLGAGELKSLVAKGVEGTQSHIRSEEELAIAGFGGGEPALNGETLPGDFFMAGKAASGSDHWSTTQSVSSFGENGAGAWAALRVLPDQHRVWLSRDQFGQQPLYYAEKAGATAFSTSLPWLFESGFVSRQFDADRFGELVQLQFLSGTSAPFADVRRVLPGETLVIERGRIIDRLRKPQVPLSDRRTTHHDTALDTLDVYLGEVIKSAIGEDTGGADPVGCVLTGDLSSTVLAIALARSSRKKAFAFVPVMVPGNGGRGSPDLTKNAGMEFARSLGLEAIAVPISETAFWEQLPQIASAMADPVGDYAALAWYGLAQAAKAKGARLLLPTGGQELFGAYGRYRTAARPLWLGGRAMRSRGHLQGLDGHSDAPSDGLSHWRDGMTGAESKIKGGSFSRVQTLQLLDLATWLPNDTMLGEHQLLHAGGVDVVRPFLDPVLAGFAFALPDQLKLRGGQGGLLLRDWIKRTYPTARNYLEAERPAVPLFDWIASRADALGPAVETVLTDAQLMPNGQAKDIFTQLGSQSNKRLGMAAWQLLYFACWYRIHVSGAAYDGDVSSLLGTSN